MYEKTQETQGLLTAIQYRPVHKKAVYKSGCEFLKIKKELRLVLYSKIRNHICARKAENIALRLAIQLMPKRTRDDNEKKQKPKKTRRSSVEDEVRCGDTSNGTRVRTSIIATALSTLLRNNTKNRKSITRTLDRLARYGGTCRHLTGIFGAHVLLCLDHEAGGTSRENLYSEMCREFLTASALDPWLFPPTMNCHLRQSGTRDMETSARNLVKIHTTARVALHRHEVWVRKGPRGWSFQAVPDLPSLVDCRSSYVGDTFVLACFTNRKYSPAMCGKMR